MRLINATLPKDSYFDHALAVYEYAEQRFDDCVTAMAILNDLVEEGIDPQMLETARAEYQSLSEALGHVTKTLLDAPCVRPANMRRKLAHAIKANADASDLASIIDDLSAMELWFMRPQ